MCDLPPDPRAQGEDTPFMRAYRDRGRIKPLLRKVPLRLVTVDDLGLRGSHYVALTECVVRGVGGGVAASRVAVARVDRRAHNHAPSSLVDFQRLLKHVRRLARGDWWGADADAPTPPPREGLRFSRGSPACLFSPNGR